MLDFLIRLSLKQRALLLALATALLVLGVKKATELPIEVLPDLTKPTVTILTEAPGYAPEEVETLVTIPLENALMGANGVSRLRSVNDVALSLIFVEFDWNTDIHQARQFVQERLSGTAESLPEGVSPYMTPAASLMGNIMLVGLVDRSGSLQGRDLRTIADWTVARKLQSIPGIAEVLSMGGGVKQIQIQPQPESMLAFDVSIDQIRDAARHAVRNTTGGFLTNSDQEIMVRNLAMTTDLASIASTVVSFENDRPVRLEDVATVTWDVEPMRGDAGVGTRAWGKDDPTAIRGYPGVVLSITKSPGFDTLKLNQAVEETLATLQEALPKGVELVTLYQQSDFIELAIGNVQEALRDGAIMVALILFLFLLNLRITFITLTAIPLSLGVTILVFDLFGLSMNTMTLGGFAVAIGMVVDDAIVDVENVFRRLRENAALASPKSKIEVIALASAEVRSSIFYATLLIILVFLPLLALSGIEGRLFTPIAVATILSMAMSFFVSLTVIPALSYYLLPMKPGKVEGDGILVRLLKSAFQRTWLKLSLAQPLTVVAISCALLAFATYQYLQMGGNFLPPFRETSAVIATTTAPGTSLKTTTAIAARAQNLLLAIPDIEHVGYRVGRAERGDHVVPVSTVEFDVTFDKNASRSQAEIREQIRSVMQGIPGTFSAISTPLADRIGHMLSGVSAKVAIKIYGEDLQRLRQLGAEVAAIARSIPGLEEARLEQQASIPQLRIEVDRKRALAYGVAPGELNEQLATLLGGETLAKVYEGQKVFDLVVRLPEEWRESPQRLKSLYIDTQSGQRIPLSYVADIRQAKGPNTILRENTLRRFVVSINPTINDLNAAVETLERRIRSELELPEGYLVSFEGEYQAQQAAKRTILAWSAIILLVIVFLLYSYFRSAALVGIVLTNIPISLIGGVLYTRYTLDNISIATLVGFIAITGIAARNSIMMLSRYLHLMRHEGESFTFTMVQRGTLERLVPVLMTALSAGIALIPLVLAAEQPGKEILNPVAIVIVGGLASSTLLGLGVTPALFYAFCRKAALASVKRESAASE